MGVDEAHLVSVALGDARDEVLDVGDRRSDRGHGAAGPEPRVDLELPPPLDELEIEVEVLEVAGELPPRALHLHNLRIHLHRHPLGYVHGLRRQDRLHGV